MKYFIVDTTIIDGEFEYLSQNPIIGETREEAEAVAEKNAKEWTQDDYREFEISTAREITEQEYHIIAKYIY